MVGDIFAGNRLRGQASSPSKDVWCRRSWRAWWVFGRSLIEAVVTPSPLPTFVRIAVGIIAEAVFLSYTTSVVAGAMGRPAAWRTPDVVPNSPRVKLRHDTPRWRRTFHNAGRSPPGSDPQVRAISAEERR